ncbi:polymorphic toxin type 44 domain-containing protein [Stigmatella sp. ncwal1]|uniref:Polymorphic toxin type 44 domain-containing protein n=1 Tax=Stigmatella ashevillensis TaxID=2995309 RepID=A0ABT5DBU9_9BACT|nr:polymorphic toxin type 44 domain-containing protein [Stigmatella ashevillena]MDC0711150.1 polymorphic toxin type 44 domain-containing protein [Stigmatella ashevillena]
MSNAALAGEQVEAPPIRGDEVTPIARYILGEMVTNAHSRDAQSIHRLNDLSRQDCFAEYQRMPGWQKFLIGGSTLQACQDTLVSSKMSAILGWAMLVRENGPWDHKPYIRRTFTPAVSKGGEQVYHHYDGWLFFYDIWSNIHYGYVGRACGFSSPELLDGAGLEQIGSDVRHGRWPRASPGVQGLRRFDDSSDRQSVEAGARMYPHPPSVPELIRLVQSTPGLTRKKLNP